MQETWIWSLGQEDPLEEGMATHSDILDRRIPWTEEPGSLSQWGPKEWDMTEQLSTYTCMHKVYMVETVTVFIFYSFIVKNSVSSVSC